ncbi:MAG: stalk domain-containing protein [Chitinophagales bacterium]
MRKGYYILLVLLFLCMFFAGTALATEAKPPNTCIKWVDLHTSNESESLNSVAYGNNRFVAVGNNGTIRISDDGLSWKSIAWSDTTTYKGVIYNGKCFVAVGDFTIIRSIDGIKWNKVLVVDKDREGLYRSDGFASLVWNGKTFLAGGDSLFYSSPNGIEWDKVQSDDIASIDSPIIVNSIAFSKDKTIAAGFVDLEVAGIPLILTGQDRTWTKTEDENLPTNLVYYTGKHFVLWGRDSVYSSTDGVKWSLNQENPAIGLAWVKNIAGIMYGSDGKKLFTSQDGFSWKESNLPNVGASLNDVAANGKGTLVTVGDNGEIHLFDSPKGWRAIDTGLVYTINGAATNDKVLVTVGNAGQIRVTTDGNKWDVIKGVADKDLYCVAYLEKRFIAGGADGLVLISADGYTWHKAGTDSQWGIRSIAYGNGRFVAGGDHVSFLVSEDAEHWRKVNEDKYDSDNVQSIVFNGKLFIAATINRTYTSEDGITWKTIGDGCDFLLFDGKQVLSDDGYSGIRSTNDGSIWTTICDSDLADPPLEASAFTYIDGLYISASNNIMISSDAVLWSLTTDRANPNAVLATTKFKDSFYAFGERGLYLRGDLISLPAPAGIDYYWDIDHKLYSANGTLRRQTDGTPIPEQESIINNNILFMSAESIAAFIEGKVDSAEGKAVITKNNRQMTFRSGSKSVTIDNVSYPLPAPCFISGNKLMLPAIFTFNRAGITADYDGAAKLLTLSYKTNADASPQQWTAINFTGNIVFSLAWNGETYAAYVNDNSTFYIATSFDGVHWINAKDVGNVQDAKLLVIGKRIFLIGTKCEPGHKDEMICWYSDDLKTWNKNPDDQPPPLAYEFAYNGKTVLTMGEDNIYRTTDGLTWTKTATLPESCGIRWTGESFLVSCSKGIYQSKDGISWEILSNGISSGETDILNETYFGVIDGSIRIKNNNGKWIESFSMPCCYLQLAGKTDKYMLAATSTDSEDQVQLYKTADGSKWSHIIAPPIGQINCMLWDGKRVFVGGYDGLYAAEIK